MGERKGTWGRIRLGLGVTSTIAAAALAAAAPAGASGAATTFTVLGFADGTGSCGAVDANGNVVCTTLRAAAQQASLQANSPTIELEAGAYDLNAASGGQLDVGAFTIRGAGPGGPSGTTIEQTDGQNRVIEVLAGPAKLVGVEVTGGSLAPTWSSGTTWLGGGILAEGAIVLQNVLVTGNQITAPPGPSPGDAGNGAEGGGVAYAAGTRAGSGIADSVISGNGATGGQGATGGSSQGGNGLGGGIAYEGAGPLVVQSSTISQNTATGGGGGGPVAGGGGKGGAGNGGGIFNSSDITLEADTIAGNSATGGMQGAPASPSSFGGAGWGGGIFSQGASDLVINSTVFGNAAQAGPAATNGSAGNAYGGGIFPEGSGVSTTLQSDTIAANRSSDIGGNLGTATPYLFTIRDTILAAGAPGNCGLASPPTSESNNLEDDATDSCSFATANHDLVGADPQLASALANNGGPTQTLIPAATSPVIGAGGQCLDPTSAPPNQTLATDQRGEPRPNPCDIGAYQSQAPRNTFPPLISGRVLAGQTVNCVPGLWTGDGPFTFGYQWLRNGAAIPGAGSSSYKITKTDIGHALACRVAATHYGSGGATSASAEVLPIPVVTLLKAKMSGRTIAVKLGCRGARGEVCGGIVKLTTVEEFRGKRLVAVIASQKRRRHTALLALRGYTIAVGHTVTLRLYAGGPTSQLLKQFGKLTVRLAVTQSTALGTQTPASRIFKLPPPPGKP